MKNITLLLIAITLIKLPGYAQFVDAKGPQSLNSQVTLAGVHGLSIEIQQIKEQPVVRVAQAQKQITAFDFSWTIRTASGSSELEGPYHNSGDKLNAISMTSLLKDAAKGIVTRIYIDEVYVANSDGISAKLPAGASYKVKP